MTVNSVLRQWKQEDQTFNIILSYLVSSKPAWAMLNPVSGREKSYLRSHGQDRSIVTSLALNPQPLSRSDA